MFTDNQDFAATDEEAAKRFALANKTDPFPEIPPALLNSADIMDYVRMTGLLHPFHKEKLKSASYEAAIHGSCFWCDDSGEQHEVRLEEGKDEELILHPNSIAFVQVEPYFRLPSYIALRFNLRITHVHRGLLLGTGPLVDPGFAGRLLIPLHNLTSKDYTLIGGEGLIWVEFTKLSRFVENDKDLRDSKRVLFTIPERKIELDAQRYFNRASDGVPARSSIPGEVKQ